MIHLVKHFLMRARPKSVLIVSLWAVLSFLAIEYLFPTVNRKDVAWSMFLMPAILYGAMLSLLIREADEFDLALPVCRRKLYIARNVAALLVVAIIAAPVSATAWAAGAFRDSQSPALQFFANVVFCWTAMFLVTVIIVRLVKRTALELAMPGVIGLCMIICFLLMTRLEAGEANLLPAVAAMIVAATAWILDARHFERYELAPNREAGPAQVAATRSGLIDRFSPMVRILAHAVWMQWRYSVLLVGLAPIGFMLAAKNLELAWLYLVFGNAIIVRLSRNGEALLPFVSRRTILRSVLGPFMAIPVLVGGVWAITSGSAHMIVRGLVMALVIVGMTWLMLPSAKEYRRPFLVSVRHNIWWVIAVCIFACGFVPGVADSFRRPLSEAWPRITPLVAENPTLVSCMIVLAIALLWWRCERKFKYFEPFVLRTGFSNAA